VRRLVSAVGRPGTGQTTSDDEATALADRIRAAAPGALRVTAEGSAAVAMDELNPFTVVSGRWRRV
jgi:hypothetical protein